MNALANQQTTAPPMPAPPNGAPTAPYPSGDNPEVAGWRRFLMIVGIIAGFSCYIVPGFFGIRTYRMWKRGEIPSPIGWMVFGAAYLALFLFLFIVTVLADS